MTDREPVDTMAPWTIKSVSATTREAITKAARREGLTVGQWLEKRVGEWEEEGSPVQMSHGAPLNLGDLAAMMQAARALAMAAKEPVPPRLARDGMGVVRRALKQAKGQQLLLNGPPPREG